MKKKTKTDGKNSKKLEKPQSVGLSVMAITPLISFLGVSSFAISPFSPRKVTRHNSNPEQPDRRSGRYDP